MTIDQNIKVDDYFLAVEQVLSRRREQALKGELRQRDERIKILEESVAELTQKMLDQYKELAAMRLTKYDRKARRLRIENHHLVTTVRRCAEALKGEGAACPCDLSKGHLPACRYGQITAGAINRPYPVSETCRQLQAKIQMLEAQLAACERIIKDKL